MREMTPPNFMNSINEILTPDFFAIPMDTILAEAPIMVIFPPRHAPKASAHQSCSCKNKFDIKGSALCMISMIGIIVMVNGILSKNPDTIPETH